MGRSRRTGCATARRRSYLTTIPSKRLRSISLPQQHNRPKFIACCLYIKPGSPWENGHIESFHDQLGDECLNRELFGNLHEARVILEKLACRIQ